MLRPFLALVLVLFIGYGFLKAVPLVLGPSLSISSPINGATYQSGVVEVEGTTSRVVALTLNGAPLLKDQTGRFSSTLTFPSGGSVLTFIATDRFGRQVRTTRSIFIPS